jgi:ADP-ribose pyrophosphatase YjhB (NUDIX family)
MFALAQRIWDLPWPGAVRRAASPIIWNSWLQRLVIPHFRIGVVGVVQNDQHQVLLFRHTYRPRYPWGLPTGFLEHREQPVEAIAREIREEAGFEVEVAPLCLAVVEPKRSHANLIYRGRFLGGSFVPSPEVSEARFFDLDDLPALLPDQRGLLETLRKEVLSH